MARLPKMDDTAPEDGAEIIDLGREMVVVKPSIESMLNQPLDHSLVKKRLKNPRKPKGPMNPELSYIGWTTAVRQLNRLFGYGNWSTGVVRKEFLGQREDGSPQAVSITLSLSIRFPDGRRADFENEGIGINRLGLEGLDMAIGKAVGMALNRCATALGDQFGLSLYDKDDEDSSTETEEETPAKKSRPAEENTDTGRHASTDDDTPFACQEPGCDKVVTSYTSNNGKHWTAKQLADMSLKQTGGLYCYNHKAKHAK